MNFRYDITSGLVQIENLVFQAGDLEEYINWKSPTEPELTKEKLEAIYNVVKPVEGLVEIPPYFSKSCYEGY